MGSPRSLPDIPAVPTGGGDAVSTAQPSACTPVSPTPSSAAKPLPSTMNDIEENNEIFVPGGSKSPPAANRYNNTNEDGNDDEPKMGET